MNHLITFVVIAVVALSLLSTQVHTTVNAVTTEGRHCPDNTSCISGTSVELSSAKWKCINNILEGAFEKATSNTKRSDNRSCDCCLFEVN